MDDRVFRNAMGKFPTGVTVITTEAEEDIHGMTANAFMSVSLDPKLITVSIDERAQMNRKINQSGKFAVSILSDEQQDVSMNFAGQTKDDRDVNFDFVSGVPVIKNSLATLVCQVYNSHKAGDHTLYIGEVIDVVLNDGSPLTFFEGKYGLQQTV